MPKVDKITENHCPCCGSGNIKQDVTTNDPKAKYCSDCSKLFEYSFGTAGKLTGIYVLVYHKVGEPLITIGKEPQ